ncbi:MAG TPA: hypothetical protein VJI68_02480 [Candidatus Nanoarchaeia archaeon]|nr:hypothetical protein [Candidatus Nanoarchaeia archaeon]
MEKIITLSIIILFILSLLTVVVIAESGSGDSDSSGSGSSGDSSDSGSGSSQNSGSSESSSNGESSSGSSNVEKTDVTSEDGTRTKTQVKSNDIKTDVRLIDGARIKTRLKDGEERVDVYQGNIKVRFETKDNRFTIKVQKEGQAETEEELNEIFLFQDRQDKDQIRIKSLGEQMIIQKQDINTLTALPVSVDLATNILKVTTSNGEKEIILPNQAVKNILAANVISRISGLELVNLVRQEQAQNLSQIILLAEQNGFPIYEVNGIKDQRLFGFIPVTTKVNVKLSAETGEVVDTEQSFVDKIFETLSTDVEQNNIIAIEPAENISIINNSI